jgi:hypothetical protein
VDCDFDARLDFLNLAFKMSTNQWPAYQS